MKKTTKKAKKETPSDKRLLYVVVRIGESVLFGEYDMSIKDTLRNALDAGVTMDFLLYSCAEHPINVYKEKIGEQITPFALSMYGTIEARAQGVSYEHAEDFFTNLDNHLGISTPSEVRTGYSAVLPEQSAGA